jgi:Cys-tRNA(Pro)/Cys-tRNA(Cys) deacylase
MTHTAPEEDGPVSVFERARAIVERGHAAHAIHAHEPTRTMDDAKRLSLDRERIVKTVAFCARDGKIILAALPGTLRVDYAGLAALAGVSRRDLSPLSPPEVVALLGVEPGAVSPLGGGEGALVCIDERTLTIVPTLYCGIGRPDRTLEIAPVDLARLCGGLVGRFSR